MKTVTPGILIVALVLAGCTAAPPKATLRSNDMAGVWYGNAGSADDHEQQGDNLIVRNRDGSFVIYFRLCRPEQSFQVAVETGTWSYTDGVLTTTTHTFNGEPVRSDDYYIEHYDVRRTAMNRIQLVSHRPQHMVFDAERVNPSSFVMPVDPCANRRTNRQQI